MPVQKFTDRLNWEDLRFFEALAENRSLSAAARQLGVTHATVARRIGHLADQFDGPLFLARSDGYALTALGEAVRMEVVQMRTSQAAILKLRRGAATRPLVRVSVMRSLGDLFIVPGLATIAAELEEIELEFLMETRVVSLAKWEADIAIRLDVTTNSDLVGRVVGANRYRLAVAPGGRRDRFIGFSTDDRSPQSVWMEAYAQNRSFSFRSNSMIAQRAATLAGLGVALLPHVLVAGTGLETLETPSPPPDRRIVVLSRRQSLDTLPVRIAFDALIRLFRLGWPQ